MSENESKLEDPKIRARAFFDKALKDLYKSNYSVAEFYFQAAVKEDPENQEYQVKLEEVQKILTQEKGAAEQAKACKAPPPGSSPAQPQGGQKKDLAAKKGFRIFGITLKNTNPRIIYATVAVLLAIAVSYSIYATLTKQDAHVNIADVKKIYGIELRNASLGEGKLQGFITESWSAMPRGEKEIKVRQLFQDFHKSRGIKNLILWDENFSAAAEASESGVNISP